jgi:hypothetical protein
MRLLTGRGQPGVPVARGRRVMSTGLSLFLIALGAILVFAVPASLIPGFSLRVTGIIVIILGVVGLLLPPVMRVGPRSQGLRGFINPSGVDDPAVHNVQDAAAEYVTQIRQD